VPGDAGLPGLAGRPCAPILAEESQLSLPSLPFATCWAFRRSGEGWEGGSGDKNSEGSENSGGSDGGKNSECGKNTEVGCRSGKHPEGGECGQDGEGGGCSGDPGL
jgi:hypothetical protein